MRTGLVRKPVLSLVLVLAASSLLAMDINKLPPDNWAAPATWSPAAKSHVGLRTLGDVTQVLPFIGLAPCRLVDTRGNGAPITGGVFTGGADVRNYAVAGICGIPTSARALSLNFTVTPPGQTTPGFLLAWPTGGAVPPVSILNWDRPPQQIANAAVVPTSASVSFTVNVSAPTNLVIDVNGYFPVGDSANLVNPGEHFEVAGNETGLFGLITGRNNSTVTNTRGVLGISADLSINSDSWTHAAGRFESVSGNGAIGLTNNLGSCGVIGAQYNSAGTPISRGLLSCDGNGLEAFALQTGVRYGVTGETVSTTANAAGVRGDDGVGSTTNAGFFSAGVDGRGKNGVLGRTNTGGGDGVVGETLNSAGAELTQGVLGTGVHGVWAFAGDIGCSSCVKAFVDPHPTDPTKEIHFVSLEGNEAGTYFRGTAETSGKEFVIQVPEDFRLVTDQEGLTVQLTPVGAPATMYVVAEGLDQIVVRSSRDVRFHYLVQGVRAAFRDVKTIQDMSSFLPQTPDGRMPLAWAEATKQRLIANGTYNKDGSLNMETAERVGWAQKWREQEAAEKAQMEAKSQSGPGAGKDN